MKVRTGFVSNSSSCSFVLDKRDMTDEQIAEFRQVVGRAEAQIEDTCIHETAKHFMGDLSMHDEIIPEFLNRHRLDADTMM